MLLRFSVGQLLGLFSGLDWFRDGLLLVLRGCIFGLVQYVSWLLFEWWLIVISVEVSFLIVRSIGSFVFIIASLRIILLAVTIAIILITRFIVVVLFIILSLIGFFVGSLLS